MLNVAGQIIRCHKSKAGKSALVPVALSVFSQMHTNNLLDAVCAVRTLLTWLVIRHKRGLLISSSAESTKRGVETLERPQERAIGGQSVFFVGLSRTLRYGILLPKQRQGFQSSCIFSNSAWKPQMTAWGPVRILAPLLRTEDSGFSPTRAVVSAATGPSDLLARTQTG